MLPTVKLLPLVLVVAATFLPPCLAQEREVRIGVVAFEDFEEEIRKWQQVFASFPGRSERKFRIAVGTYGDLLHWMHSDHIDVGILTSGVFAEGLAGGLVESAAHPKGAYRYVATIGLPLATSVWAADDRRASGYHYRYRSVCVVAAGSSLRSVEDIRARAGELQFLFVHPLSVSGRIAPESALQQLGIRPDRRQVQFSFSHSNSLRLVADETVERERVAFVWDDAPRATPELSDLLRRVEIGDLDGLDIPHDVVVVRKSFEGAAAVGAFFEKHVDDRRVSDFRRLEDWETRYGRVGSWLEALALSSLADETQTVTLDEIGQILLHGVRSRTEPPRLALVMSGGGAKCAYQVGAIAALERKLAALRQRHADPALDISLVIGTSGGAMNALPVALGVPSTEEGQAAFAETWKALDQRRMVRPSAIFRANIGVWFALLVTALALLVVRSLVRAEMRGWWFGWLLLTIGSSALLLGWLDYSPWGWLGEDHVRHHVWLWMSFGKRAFAWCLIALGAGFLALRWTTPTMTLGGRRFFWPVVACLAILPLVQVVTVLLFQTTLSSGRGIERVLATEFPELINVGLARDGEAPLTLAPGVRAAARLRQASRQITERHLARRDLVITGSCIRQSKGSLPSDLYFYLKGPSGLVPPEGPRWIDLERHPSQLLDVVMGSGSIFPVFPPRVLSDFPQPGEQVELVDGGFAHNSPTEAAVLWGATHIVLIEATPMERKPQENLLQNASAAFAHLYKQTQLVDIRSKSRVMVFTLAPEPPHLCVVDFAGNLVEAAIERGYEDAVGAGGVPRFRKELSEPVFTDLAVAVAP